MPAGALLWAALKHSAQVVAATNAVGFVTTALTQSHKVTDLTGTAAFAASAWATHAAAARASGASGLLAPSKSLLLAGAVTLWTARLGGYLFFRVLKLGKDERLDQFFRQPGEPLLTGPSLYPLRLAFFWTAQGLWAWACLLPVTAAHALASARPGRGAGAGLRIGPSLVLGLLLFGGGLLLETVADWQKFSWKSDPANRGKFMGPVGVFKYSQFPNYAGEIAVWLGLLVAAGPGVWRAAPWAAASPLFSYLLLRCVSGVPLLAASYEARFGGQEAYEAYRASTNLLLPWWPRKG